MIVFTRIKSAITVKKKHFQKIYFKKQHNDKINDIIINKENNLNHVFINVFIIFEKFHKN